jgi:hypothetical protein
MQPDMMDRDAKFTGAFECFMLSMEELRMKL